MMSKGDSVVGFLSALDTAQTLVGAIVVYGSESVSEVLESILWGLYESGAIVHANAGRDPQVHPDTADRELALADRTDGLSGALERIVGGGLSLPGFLTTAGVEDARLPLARNAVREAEYRYWRALAEHREIAATDHPVVGKFLNVASDVLFAVDVTTRTGDLVYWCGHGKIEVVSDNARFSD
jgi:cob(I)alamin adenosyltransferase